jgi:glutathione S-transferase
MLFTATYLADTAIRALLGIEDPPPPPPTSKTIKIGYWAIRGLAAPLRMMADYAGIESESVCYELVEKEGGGWDRGVWITDAKPALQDRNSLMNLPYIDDAGGLLVTQSNACLGYLGRKTGLLGATEVETTQVEQLLCQAMDFRNDAVRWFYGGDGSKAAEQIANLEGHYNKFEAWLQQSDTVFLVGATPTAADFALWEMLDQHEMLCKEKGLPSPLDARLKLAVFYVELRNTPKLAGYFSGPLYKLPLNNKSAQYGQHGEVEGRAV